MNTEWFDLIDEQADVIGRAQRSVCHGHPGLVHQAVHVLVFNQAGDLFLQKRSASKDIQPGKWDTSVGGHVNVGEQPLAAARREMREELGIHEAPLEYAYHYRWTSDRESERITSYATRHEGPFTLDPGEIDDGRFWSLAEIRQALPSGRFTPQFAQEFARMTEWHAARFPQ
jgi:isopentenyldiphosphate isomerase